MCDTGSAGTCSVLKPDLSKERRDRKLDNLSAFILRRKQRFPSRSSWRSCLAVSVPTLIRMEKGDPTVGMGVYATALWFMGRHAVLPEVAAPEHDRNALKKDIEAARQRSRRLSRRPAESL